MLGDFDEILVSQGFCCALLLQRADDLHHLELKLLQRTDFPLELVEELKRSGESEGWHASIVAGTRVRIPFHNRVNAQVS
ncbi:hypothetical protein, partial [Lentzea roselyniae]|uniref:hypothetical protein n=1 Tax=Lentzea roselyniae TaxID=531940 RepID=UPI0031F8D965